MTQIKLQKNFLGAFQENMRAPGDVTVSLQDGSVDINKMIFILAGEFWRDMFRTLEMDEVAIIIPDYKVSSLNRMIEVILTGETTFQSTEHDQYLESQDFALNTFRVNINKLNYSQSSSDKKKFSVLENLSPEDCRFCAKGFANKQSRKRHEAHCCATDNHWICDLCAKTFKTEQGLVSHKTQHDVYATCRFDCSNCSATYKSLSELRRHCKMYKHSFPAVEGPTLENEVRCEICFKEIKKCYLKYHMRKHENQDNKMFKCEDCDYSTLRKNNLFRHYELKHNTFNINLEAIEKHFENHKSFTCQKCGETYVTILAAKNHFLKKDCKDMESLVCKFCPFKRPFKMKQNLKAHMKRKHPGM